MKRDRRVVVVGLDGGTYEVLDRMMAKGLMPNLRETMQGAACGEMDTYVSGLGQGWASFTTGMDPRKHGVFYWVLKDRVTSEFFAHQALWEVLSDHGRVVGVVNVSYTFPPKPVNGFLISGLGSGLRPRKGVVFSHPPDLIERLERETGGYEWGWTPLYNPGQEKAFLRNILRVTDLRCRAALHLFREYDTDFSIVVFRGVDAIQHRLWNHLDPENPVSREDPDVLALVERYFARLDAFLGDVRQGERKTALFVISDHGFGASRSIFQINELLAREGYLVKSVRPRARLLGAGTRVAKRVLGKYARLIRFSKAYQGLDRKASGSLRSDRAFVDWSRTRAFGDSNRGISINLQGRNPAGIVPRGSAYESLREEIIERLLAVTDPRTGEKIFERIYKREDLGLQRSFDLAPDLLFEPVEGYQANLALAPPGAEAEVFRYLENERFRHGTGIHRRNGVLIARGDGIDVEGSLSGARIIDLAPTILHLLGVPVPEDMDGRVLRQILLGTTDPQEARG